MAGTVCIQRQDFGHSRLSGFMERGEIQLPISVLCAVQDQRDTGIVQSAERIYP